MSFPDQNNEIARKMPSRNAVIITYYVESSTTPQSKHKKLKLNPFHKNAQTTRKRGYDRRAELLAYANELRVSDPQKVHWSRRSSRCKTNKRKWSITSARLRSVLSIRIFKGRKGRWKYERRESEANTDVNKRKKNNSETTNTSDICRKLKCLLKELPFGCQCYKGMQ